MRTLWQNGKTDAEKSDVSDKIDKTDKSVFINEVYLKSVFINEVYLKSVFINRGFKGVLTNPCLLTKSGFIDQIRVYSLRSQQPNSSKSVFS